MSTLTNPILFDALHESSRVHRSFISRHVRAILVDDGGGDATDAHQFASSKSLSMFTTPTLICGAFSIVEIDRPVS
jgi:hypothetical protein